MKFCTQCGAKIKDEAVFCPACGHKIAMKAENQTAGFDNKVTATPPQRPVEIPKTAVPVNPAPVSMNYGQVPTPQPTRKKKAGKWIIAGVGLVVIAAGVVFALGKFGKGSKKEDPATSHIAETEAAAEQKIVISKEESTTPAPSETEAAPETEESKTESSTENVLDDFVSDWWNNGSQRWYYYIEKEDAEHLKVSYHENRTGYTPYYEYDGEGIGTLSGNELHVQMFYTYYMEDGYGNKAQRKTGPYEEVWKLVKGLPEDYVLKAGEELYANTGYPAPETVKECKPAENYIIYRGCDSIDYSPALEEVIWYSSEVYLDPEWLGVMEPDLLRIARNEIYARHGRKFSTSDLQEHFNGCSWYQGTVEPSAFDENCLSEIEKYNISLIEKYENGELSSITAPGSTGSITYTYFCERNGSDIRKDTSILGLSNVSYNSQGFSCDVISNNGTNQAGSTKCYGYKTNKLSDSRKADAWVYSYKNNSGSDVYVDVFDKEGIIRFSFTNGTTSYFALSGSTGLMNQLVSEWGGTSGTTGELSVPVAQVENSLLECVRKYGSDYDRYGMVLYTNADSEVYDMGDRYLVTNCGVDIYDDIPASELAGKKVGDSFIFRGERYTITGQRGDTYDLDGLYYVAVLKGDHYRLVGDSDWSPTQPVFQGDVYFDKNCVIEGYKDGSFTTADDYFGVNYENGRFEDGFQNGINYGRLRIFGWIVEIGDDGTILYHKERFVS